MHKINASSLGGLCRSGLSRIYRYEDKVANRSLRITGQILFDRLMNYLAWIWLGIPSLLLTAADPMPLTPANFRDAKQPQVAISSEGTIYVVFGKENGIYVCQSEDVADKFSSPVKIGEVPKLALGMRRGPRVAASGKFVTVTAISHAEGNLYSWASNDGARSWSKAARVNSVTNSAREGLHASAGDGESKLFSVWLDLRSGKTELWSSVSNDGGNRWEENRRVYKSPSGSICECCHPSAVIKSNGEIVVMWRNSVNGERDMYQCVSADGGKSFKEAKKIGTGTWTLNACPMDGGSLGANSDTIRYSWRREGRLFATGEIAGETLLVDAGTQPVVAVNGSGFAYLWQSGGNLYLKRSELSPAEVLAENAGYAASAWSEKAGKSVIVWEGGDGAYVRTMEKRK